jgi:hypothetical protein
VKSYHSTIVENAAIAIDRREAVAGASEGIGANLREMRRLAHSERKAAATEGAAASFGQSGFD